MQLLQLDSSISASFIGLIMAVSGVGEAVAAPILGYWTNRTGVVIPPLIASVVMSLVGNPEIYESTDFSGNRGTYFAYIAAASEPTDRARSMALSGGGALIGLNVGPAVQMLFTWIGSDGIDIGFMRLSMYTAPALLAIVINVACVFLLLIFLNDGLDRYNGPDSDTISTYSIAAAEDSDLERNAVKTVRMDVLAVVVCMWTRAARMLITANVESIGSPFSQVMFGLDNEQVLNYNAMMQGAVGVLTTGMFLVYVFTPYSKWISERLNCLGAMVALLIFHLVTFSWPFLPGQLNCDKYVENENDSGRNTGSGSIPSPKSKEQLSGTQQGWSWCESLRPINFWLYYIGYPLIFGIALPCLNNSLQSLYSQILGKGRQGTMQGVNQAVGCISRICGPLLMS
ncbi:hypothetical protein OESDEN_06349 [Oesophagostomum dentatum]|uniref:Transporter, major facilitator family protein n=1 Tax=Oesophagostomum dentatum TaxID=61180 RepID=A0A0B1TED3_OESDE|nr:hypothetical protein OESDEN_06349 [Oesophagostomum dentatum]